MMTDIPDLVRVAVVALKGNSDHSSLLAVISITQAVPNLCVGGKILLKYQDKLEYCLWCNTGSALA